MWCFIIMRPKDIWPYRLSSALKVGSRISLWRDLKKINIHHYITILMVFINITINTSLFIGRGIYQKTASRFSRHQISDTGKMLKLICWAIAMRMVANGFSHWQVLKCLVYLRIRSISQDWIRPYYIIGK